MMTTTTPKPREGQVAGFPKEQAVMLTESNAYRAKSIRRTGTDEAPVLFISGNAAWEYIRMCIP